MPTRMIPTMITPLAVALLSLGVVTHDVALLAPGKPPREADRTSCGPPATWPPRFPGCSTSWRIHADTLSREDLLNGGLRQRQVVILAYNPYLDEQAAGTLARSCNRAASCWSATCCRRDWRRCSASARSSTSASSGRGSLPRSGSTPPICRGCRNRSGRILEHHGRRPAGYTCPGHRPLVRQAGQPTGRPALLLSDRGAS